MTDWVRLWHDMPTDPKWRVIARKSRQPLPCVVAVFTLMLTNASANSGERGVLLGWDHEDAGAALDMDAEDVAAIHEAMQGKVLDGDRLTGWERRQPKREDSTAAERKAAWKARKQAEENDAERAGTHGNASERTREETETETDHSVAKATGTVVPLVDPEKVMFDQGIRYLATAGVSEAKARSQLGKWRRDHGAGAVIEALGAAQRLGIVEPIGWIEGRWRAERQVLDQRPAVPL